MTAVTPTSTGFSLGIQYLTEMKRLSQWCVFAFGLGYMVTTLTGWYCLTSGFGSGCYESNTFRSMWHMHGKYKQGKAIEELSEMWNGDNFLPSLLNMNSSYFLSSFWCFFIIQSIYKSLSREWKQLDKLYYNWKNRKKTLQHSEYWYQVK